MVKKRFRFCTKFFDLYASTYTRVYTVHFHSRLKVFMFWYIAFPGPNIPSPRTKLCIHFIGISIMPSGAILSYFQTKLWQNFALMIDVNVQLNILTSKRCKLAPMFFVSIKLSREKDVTAEKNKKDRST